MLYFINSQLQSLNYLDSGICGRLEFSSSSFSKTDCVSRSSSREIATIAILQIINKAATIEVNLVKKVPTDLVDVKLSCETPRPKAPPSDLCKRITMINITASMIFTSISTVSYTHLTLPTIRSV